jgi:EF-P beta-lysylation protein EpmB
MGQIPLWRQIQRGNFTQWEQLADFLHLDLLQRESILKNSKFSLNIPKRLAEKIVKGTLEDPILLQFLPTVKELSIQPNFIVDPVNDSNVRTSPKLLQKYPGRALLLCTSACAMHCRYCFRQHFDYETIQKGWENELSAIANDPSLKEIILSGGDPLSLSDEQVEHLLDSLNAIPHVRLIRFHTRFPIGIPERIHDQFLEILSKSRKQIWFVIHCNHPRELDEEILSALKKLNKLGITLLNQAVLLKGVNDDVSTLAALCERLIEHGIFPYYLHQLDRVQGAGQFEVSEDKGLELISSLTKRLPGYGIPKYVKEIPGELSKVTLHKE